MDLKLLKNSSDTIVEKINSPLPKKEELTNRLSKMPIAFGFVFFGFFFQNLHYYPERGVNSIIQFRDDTKLGKVVDTKEDNDINQETLESLL